MGMNVNGDNSPTKPNNKTNTAKTNGTPSEITIFVDNNSTKSGDLPTIFAPKDKTNVKIPTVIGELEKQNTKLDNASNRPAFEMTKAERQKAEKLNKEQKQRANYQKTSEEKEKAQKARERVIRNYSDYIKKYKIDVKGKTAEQIKKEVLENYQKDDTIGKPKQNQGTSSKKQESEETPRSYNYATDPKPVKNHVGFSTREYNSLENERENLDSSNYDMDERDKTDEDFVYTSERSTSRTEETDKSYRKQRELQAENEIDSRKYSYDKSAIMVETYGGFREATVFGDKQGYHGKVGNNTFKMYKRENGWDPGSQYLGRIGRLDVDIEEREIQYTMNGLNHYFGKIGDDDFEMESKSKEFSHAGRIIYEGKYKGISFQVEVGRDNTSKDDGDRVIRGYFGGQRVDIKKRPAKLTDNDRLKIKNLPKDFENVASFIFVAQAELEKSGRNK